MYTNRQYDKRVRELMELESLKADIQKQIDAIEEDIQADMGDTDAVVTKNFVITWKHIISRRFDSKAFKQEHEKLYNQFLTTAESRRFLYKSV